MSRTTLKIEGMTCGHCVMSVKKALQSLDGVEVEQVAIGTATVAYDPARATPDAIARAVTDSGYTAAAA
jgi:copper chaperone CopZ